MLFIAEDRQSEQPLVAVDRSVGDLTPRGKVESDVDGGGLRAHEFASVGGSEHAGRMPATGMLYRRDERLGWSPPRVGGAAGPLVAGGDISCECRTYVQP
ncbi:hypothetical protein [Micromonospora coriariae]|uniref:hypothetical protein n=1 Tax=Micromonospora coriariae TaxID=285665 RepID=UPI0012FDCB40|nr:hypothetical protein [Micromonospora coriariae]